MRCSANERNKNNSGKITVCNMMGSIAQTKLPCVMQFQDILQGSLQSVREFQLLQVSKG